VRDPKRRASREMSARIQSLGVDGKATHGRS